MSGGMEPEALLALAKRSPEHVGAHDLDAWRGLFAPDGRVEDPVGTPPCRRGEEDPDGLVRFWRAFIAPHRIWFEERLDLASRTSVARDVLIRMKMSSGLESAVPAYLLYDFVETPEGPKVSRLAAHWEASRASKAMLGEGALGVRTVVASAARVFFHFGLGAGRAYMRGTQGGVRARGKARAGEFAAAWTARDRAAVAALCGAILVDDELVQGEALDVMMRRPLELVEPRASGHVVAARLRGFGADERAADGTSDGSGDGLGFFTFEPEGERIASVRLFAPRR